MILVTGLFLSGPSPKPVTIPTTTGISATDFVAPTAPQPPSGSIAINGQKIPPSLIHLQVMANTCIPGDVNDIRISVNGAQKGMLGTSWGASGTFAGTSGTNSVTVVAKFANGAESVVYMGSIG